MNVIITYIQMASLKVAYTTDLTPAPFTVMENSLSAYLGYASSHTLCSGILPTFIIVAPPHLVMNLS